MHGVVGDLDHDAIGHHRAVERHHGIGIVGREQLRTAARHRRPSSTSRSVRMLSPFPDRTSRTASARTRHPPAPPGARPRWRAASGRCAARFSAAASGAAASGSTSRISTRRSVYFQSSIRRCGRPGALVGFERLPPEIGDLACAGQPVTRDGEDIARARGRFRSWPVLRSSQNPFSLRPRLRTGRSRKLPAPAPVPCRRSSRPCPSTSRGRNRARCSSAAADNA